MRNEWIKIGIAIKKDEVDENIINWVKIKIGLKYTFLRGILAILEEEKMKRNNPEKKHIEVNLERIKRCIDEK